MRIGVKRVRTWSIVALVLLGSGESSSLAVTLRWKFQAGETLHYEIDQQMVQTAKLPDGTEPTSKASQTIDMIWTVKSVGPDGTADVSFRIDRVRMKQEHGALTFAFDSSDRNLGKDPVTAAVATLLKSINGTPITFKFSARGEISNVKIPEGVVTALREAGGGDAQGGAGTFSTDELKKLIAQSSLALPKEDQSKGTTWSETTKIAEPPLGTITRTSTYTHQGPDPKAGAQVERVGLTAKDALEAAPDAPIALKVTAQDLHGFFLFDNAAGRLTSSSVTEKIEMIATFDQAKVTNIRETTRTSKLITENPGPKSVK